MNVRSSLDFVENLFHNSEKTFDSLGGNDNAISQRRTEK